MKIEITKKEVAISALVESETNPGAHYKVDLENGDWNCTCPAYTHGKGTYCKHIRAVKEEI